MSVPIDSIIKLPLLASYSAKSGQANARLSREEGNIIVYATCDSLEQLVTYYEEFCENYKQQNDHLQLDYEELIRTSSEQYSNIVRMLVPAFVFGLFMGFIIGIIVNIKKQK